MIKLSKKVEYGLISLLHIAGLESEELVTTKELAGHYHIPQEVLGKVLQALTKAELIESMQGARGGYRLRKALACIVFGEVVEAVDGPIHIAPCTCENYVCSQEATCNIQEPVFHFQNQLLAFIYSVSLESFRNRDSEDPGVQALSSEL